MEQIFRTVIVDDEESAIDNLSFELQRYSYVSVEGDCTNGKSRIESNRKDKTRFVVPGCGIARYDRDGCTCPLA